MQEIYETSIKIVPSLSDAQGLLSIPDSFALFMDIASTHAELLGFGYDAMRERGLFWLTVKTRLIFHQRPQMGKIVTLRTWPEIPGKLRCNRSYEMLLDGKVMICGKTEWAVMNFRENRLAPAEEGYPKAFAFPNKTACEEAFSRIPDSFDGIQPFADYTVRSTDIDVGQHMNNVAYVRTLASSFSNDEWHSLAAKKVEVQFRSPCYEGEQLCLQRKTTPEGLDVRISRKGDTVLLARIER